MTRPLNETFAIQCINNENFTEIPNLAETYFNTSDSKMNKTVYEVNSCSNIQNGNSSDVLYDDDDDEDKKHGCINSRIVGLIFLLILIVTSVVFLVFAIFYDEIFDDDHDDFKSKQLRFNRLLNASKHINLNISELNITRLESIEHNDDNYISIILTENRLNNTEDNRDNGITFENFIDGNLTPKQFTGKWISHYELLHYDSQNNLCITSAYDLSKTVIIHNDLIKRYHLFGLSLSADRKYLLSLYSPRRVFRYSTIAKYRIFSIENSQLQPPIFPPESPKDQYLQYAEWGPIGSQLIFIFRNDIYYKSDINSGAIRLTESGRDLMIYNGIPDWVYEEEIISAPKTFWFAPDGQKLLYTTIDDSSVDIMSWPYYGPYRQNDSTDSQYTRLVSIRYPKPGRPNPKIKMNVIELNNILKTSNISSKQITPTSVPIQPPKGIEALSDYYATAFQWIDPNRFSINWMNRAQNLSMLTTYAKGNSWIQISTFKLQSKNGWIDFSSPPLISPDKESFLILLPKMSDNKKDYFTHIAKVSIKTSKTVYLTSGVFEVKQLLEINTKTNRLFYTACFPQIPGSKHLMSVSINELEKSQPICHTCIINDKDIEENLCLVSDAKFSQNAEYYLLQCNGPSVPRTALYKTQNHSLLNLLENNLPLKFDLQQLSLPKRILMKVPSNDNNVIDVMLIVPEGFDQKSDNKYPILFHVYGGPGSDHGSVSLEYFYNQFSAYIVSNKSIIYAVIDARGSPNHGCKFMYDVYRRIGTVEVEDTITVARYFRDEVSYINADMISIWGWSYGGYLTTMSMIKDHDNPVFKCGVAVAPVSDWMFYDSVYVERFMGFPTPEDNLENYVNSSILDKVDYLRGKKFLVIFGTADDNVHAQNSMMLLKAMNEANVKYDTQLYPDNNHNLQYALRHMYRKMTDFLDNCYH